MTGFKNKIFSIINKLVDYIPPKSLQKLTGQRLILPFYHAVSNEDLPHIKHLYGVTGVDKFVADLDFLLKYYEPIDYHQFRDLALRNVLPEQPSFLLSFDDGLSEFYSLIAPILKRKGISAICFLNSGFVDNKELFYRYKASLLIEELRKNPESLRLLPADFDRPKVEQEILAVTYQNKAVLDEIAKSISFDFDSFLAERKPYLNSDQIEELINQGFYFGAHSIDHPEYQLISFEEQIRQTKESVDFVSDRFSVDYKIFSFPFTDYNVSKKFFSYIESNNLVDFSFGTAGQKKDTSIHNFQRIPFEITGFSARKIHNAELFYYLLKAPFGKNIIRRK